MTLGQPQPIMLDINELAVRSRQGKDTVYAVSRLTFQPRREERLFTIGGSDLGMAATCRMMMLRPAIEKAAEAFRAVKRQRVQDDFDRRM